MSDYYDKDGRSIEMMDWAQLFEDNGYKRIASDTVGDATISTVWMGLDHSFGFGPPLIFETMVFGGSLSDEMDRYPTLAEAETGHRAMVERVREAADA